MTNKNDLVNSKNNHFDMVVGVRYIVTHDSKNKEFQCGDHIWLNADGSISCREAHGWMPKEDVAEATRGITICIDDEYLLRSKEKLLRKLAELHA